MKKFVSVIRYSLLCVCAFCMFACSCAQSNIAQVEAANHVFDNPEDIRAFLIESNKIFMQSEQNMSSIGSERKLDLVAGQAPYALIVTCADSRVPPEHIFNAGLGDLFIVRNAGNVIGDFELGSIEYALEHVAIQYILVLGHEHCGAVDATLGVREAKDLKKDTEHGLSEKLSTIVCEIDGAIGETLDAREAEIRNTQNSVDKIIKNSIVAKFLEENKVLVEGAIYHLDTGEVVFIQ